MPSFTDIFAFGSATLVVFSGIAAWLGLLRQRSERVYFGETIFRKPLEMRVYMGVWGIVSFLFPIFMASEIWKQQDANGWIMFPIVALMCFAGSALFIHASGPADLYLNTEKRTYRLVRGWPFFARVRCGTWKEIWGIWLGRTKGRAAYYVVGITCGSADGYVILGRFSNKTSAEEFADRRMCQWELRRMIPPRNFR